MFQAVISPSAMFNGADMHLHTAWEAVNRLAFRAGELPLWNPYAFGGYPGMADIQTQVFYPPSVLLRWLPLPAFFTWGLVFHVWVLGVGVFALCRRLGISRTAGLASAAGVMLSGVVVPKLYAGHVVVLYGYAWFPLALALAIRSARRSTVLPDPALVVVLVVQLLAGFVQGTVYVFAVIGAYFIYAAARAPAGAARWRLGQAVILLTLVGALAGFQLLPTARLVLEAGRFAGSDYGFASADAFARGDFVTAVFPNALGLRWDSSVFVTLGLLACTPLAWVEPDQRRRAWCASLLAVVALGLALADTTPLYRVHHALFPQFRNPTRLLFFCTIGVAVLGGLGIDTLLRRARSRSGASGGLVPWVPALVGGLLLGLAAFQVDAAGSMTGVLGTPRAVVATQVVVLCTLGILVRRRLAGLAGVAVLLLVTTEGLVFATPQVRVRDESRPAMLDRLLTYTPSRVLSVCEDAVAASSLVADAIATPHGYGSIFLGQYARYLGLVQTGNSGGTTPLGGTAQIPARLDLMDYLDVSHVITCEPLEPPRFRFLETAGPVSLYANAAVKPRAVLTCINEARSVDAVMRQLTRSRYDATGRLVPLPPPINVRWVDGISEPDRLDRERVFGLGSGRDVQGGTWRYRLLDESVANVLSLVSDPLVADTAHIDRETGRVDQDGDIAEATLSETDLSLVVDATSCETRGTVEMLVKDRPDGGVRLTVATPDPALLFLSEPYYPERRVWVDGVERTLERVNVAFSGVRVEPGVHAVELRFVPASFYWGILLSGAALIGWIAAIRRCRPPEMARRST